MATKTFIEKLQALSDPDTRLWAKAQDIRGEVEDELLPALESATEAVLNFVTGLDARDSADEETGEDKRATLEQGWSDVSSGAETLAEQLQVIAPFAAEK